MTTHTKPKLSTYNIDISLMLRHMDVPFVPTLGCVHPNCLEVAITDVFNMSNTANFLEYDKDIRWYSQKKETVLFEYIYQDDRQTIVPTVLNNDYIKYYRYRFGYCGESGLKDLQNRLSRLFPKANTQVLSFNTKENLEYDTIIFLLELDNINPVPKTKIKLFSETSKTVQSTLPDLARDEENSGFSFIYDRFLNGFDDGDILVSVHNNKINGAVAPLKIVKDAIGQNTRFPPFFGVDSRYRRQGIGASLWNTALSWAIDKDVKYIVLQAQYGSPAEFFYKNMGLKPLGGVLRS